MKVSAFRLSSAFVIAAAVVTTPIRGAAETWTYASSEHFEIYTTAGERRARTSLTYFERVHAFFEDFLKLTPAQKYPTRLVLFSNAREFEPFRLNEVATAYYRSGPDRDYIVMRSLDADSYPLVVHEYAHLIMRHAGMAFPRWLNEGLAEFFSTVAPEGGQMALGKVPRGRHYELTSGGPMLDLARLLSVDHNSSEYNTQQHAGMFYAQSWALTHMLMTSDGYRAKSGAFLRAVDDGAQSAAAFETVYGKTLQQVSSDLRVYVRNERFAYFSANYRDPKDASGFPTRAAAPFEAGLMKANLLAEGSDTAAARAAYEALAPVNPDDLGLLEARAYFELRRGDRVVAQSFMKRAVERESQNPALYGWAASLTDSDEERASLLATAVRLDPDNPARRLSHAEALARRGDAAGALAALAPMARVPPEAAFRYFNLQAAMLAQLDRFEEATAAATLAREHARPGLEADHANRLRTQIEEFVGRRRDAENMLREANARPEDGAAAAAAGAPITPLPGPTSATSYSATDPMSGRLLTVVQGRIRNLLCDSRPVIVDFRSAAGGMRLVVDDPLLITVQGRDGVSIDMQCGPQDTPVRIGYEPRPDAAAGTAGPVRLLDFR